MSMIIIQGREGIFNRECRDQGMMLEEGGDMLSAFCGTFKIIYFSHGIYFHSSILIDLYLELYTYMCIVFFK